MHYHDLRVPAFARISEYSGLWLMEPTAFRAYWEAIERMDLRAHMDEPPPPATVSMLSMVAARGKNLAMIEMLGPLMKQKSSVGGTSTIQLRRDIRQAANDPNVSAILLAIESPGGTVAGINDLAAEVRNAKRQKPVWAHVEDLTASAAYWVASQADAIFANSPTALIGSIGTIMTVYDTSGMAEQTGVKARVFSTGPLKGAGVPGAPVTDEQAAYFQSIVNGMQAEFDAAVRTGRNLNAAQLADVRTGGVWPANEAQAKKLIDGVRPLAKTLDELAKAA